MNLLKPTKKRYTENDNTSIMRGKRDSRSTVIKSGMTLKSALTDPSYHAKSQYVMLASHSSCAFSRLYESADDFAVFVLRSKYWPLIPR